MKEMNNTFHLTPEKQAEIRGSDALLMKFVDRELEAGRKLSAIARMLGFTRDALYKRRQKIYDKQKAAGPDSHSGCSDNPPEGEERTAVSIDESTPAAGAPRSASGEGVIKNEA